MPDTTLLPVAQPLAELTKDKPVTLGDLSVLDNRYDELQSWPNTRLASNGRNHKVFAAEAITVNTGLSLEFRGSNNVIYLCEGCELTSVRLVFKGSGGTFVIGPHARIKATTMIVQSQGGSIVFGEGVTMESGTLLCQEDGMSITIGDDCMISNDVFLRTSDSHSIVDLQTRSRINPPGPIAIADHVWIGQRARVMKGVKVGRHAVIGQCAVVTADVEPYSIYAGMPARKIRGGITWKRERDS